MASVEDTCKLIIVQPGMAAGCNLFVQAVAKVYGKETDVAGNADAIRQRMNGAPFKVIGTNPELATKYAADGNKLVLGGLSKSEMTYTDKGGNKHTATMAHVVIVVPGGPSKTTTVKLKNGKSQPCRGGYPYCYQGAAMSAYRFLERTQVDAVFPSSLLNDVFYAYLDIST